MKNRFLFLLAAVMIFMFVILTGCQNQQKGTNASSSEKPKVKIGDIDWRIEEGIIDGKRCVLLNITNQSQYTLTNFELQFDEKDGLTQEQKNGFYDDIVSLYRSLDGSATDEEIEEDLNQLKKMPISMNVSCGQQLDPGENDCSNSCCYYSGYFIVTDIKHYQLVEPDIAQFEYLKDGQLYAFYYDYKSKSYTADGEPKEAYPWSDTALGQMITKPEGKIIEKICDNDTDFSFEIKKCSQSDFDAYVADCKGKGFNVSISSYETWFSGENEAGYQLSAHYYEDEKYIFVSLSSPK